MSRRTTLGALVLALLVLAASPAAAKGPTQVEVHDLRTGSSHLLGTQGGELPGGLIALMELIGQPTESREPRGVSSGALEHIATLTWRMTDETTFWVDRVYSNGRGSIWVQRTDHQVDPGTITWVRVKTAFALDSAISAVATPPDVETTAIPEAAAPKRTTEPGRHADAGFDPSSFGWGAGLAGVLATGLALVARRRRQRSVTASRNSRASSAASS
jgi:hypothetical protein